MVPVEEKERATDLERREERGRDETGDEDVGVRRVGWGGCVCGIKTKGEAKERQMEVVECRELDIEKRRRTKARKRKREEILILFKRLVCFPFVHFCYPSLTIKI